MIKSEIVVICVQIANVDLQHLLATCNHKLNEYVEPRKWHVIEGAAINIQWEVVVVTQDSQQIKQALEWLDVGDVQVVSVNETRPLRGFARGNVATQQQW